MPVEAFRCAHAKRCFRELEVDQNVEVVGTDAETVCPSRLACRKRTRPLLLLLLLLLPEPTRHRRR